MTRRLFCLAFLTAMLLQATAGPSSAAVKRDSRFPNLPAPTGGPAVKTVPDVDTLATLTPSTSTGGGIQALSVDMTFSCADAVSSSVQSFPSGYVTGNCLTGQTLRATTSGAGNGNTYWGGNVLGNYNGCGWIWASSISFTGYQTNTACASPSIPQADFIYCPGGSCYIWTDSAGQDGQYWPNHYSCPMYLNFRPWASGQTPTNYVGNAAPNTDPAHYRFKLRYITKYSYGGYQYMMMHDTTKSQGQGNWVFVPTSCI